MGVKRLAFTCSILLMVGTLYSSDVSAALRAELRPAEAVVPSSGELRSGELELVLSNTGSRPIEVLMDDLPYAVPRTGVVNPLLSVSSDGVEADFVGIVVDYSDDDVATASIAAGSVLSIRFDIYRSYAMSGGEAYTVSFRSPIRYLDRPAKEFGFASRRDLETVVKEAIVDALTVLTPVEMDDPDLIARTSSASTRWCSPASGARLAGAGGPCGRRQPALPKSEAGT